MKTRKRFRISLTIFTFLLAGLFVACQQGENINEKVRNEVEDLRDDLNDLDENDSNFADNLHSELEDFEESMNDLKEDMNESGQQISMEARQAINDLQAEARSLRMKLERRTDAGNDSGLFGDNDNRGTTAREGGANRSTTARDGDAISGDRTAQAQRDTTVRDTTGIGEGLFNDNDQSAARIDNEIRSDFQNFRQNVNQWVDRLSANTDNRQRYD